jgi:hypothetical protein
VNCHYHVIDTITSKPVLILGRFTEPSAIFLAKTCNSLTWMCTPIFTLFDWLIYTVLEGWRRYTDLIKKGYHTTEKTSL